jgi:Cytochrome c7 and related cytochrome c
MRTTRPTRHLVFLAPLLAVLAAWAVGAFGSRPVAAKQSGVLTATSVCEAHELQARKALNPDLQIEIPPQFNVAWPTRAACLSHAAAGNPDTPGPVQPIQFSHKHHAGLYQIDCQYCHSGTDRSPSAGVPPVELCMGCHAQFPPSYDELEGIRTLKEHWGIEVVKQDGQWKELPRDPAKAHTIEWAQINRLPEYVQFQHRTHVQAGVDCRVCHGPIEQMDKVYQTEDTIYWPWLLPSKKMEMGWCINCHRENGATQDCLGCHY